jgi:hypothetical protein
VIFDLDNGMKISLYERKYLAWDSGPKQQPESASFRKNLNKGLLIINIARAANHNNAA